MKGKVKREGKERKLGDLRPRRITRSAGLRRWLPLATVRVYYTVEFRSTMHWREAARRPFVGVVYCRGATEC